MTDLPPTPAALVITVPIQLKIDFEGVIYVCYGLATQPTIGEMDLKCVDESKAKKVEQTIVEAARVKNKKAPK